MRPVGGFLADRLGGIRVLSLLYTIIAVLLFGLSTLPTLSVAVVLLFLIMASLGTGNGRARAFAGETQLARGMGAVRPGRGLLTQSGAGSLPPIQPGRRLSEPLQLYG